jgi:hypothetical protein
MTNPQFARERISSIKVDTEDTFCDFYFEGDYIPYVASEFVEGSPTRILMDTIDDLIREYNDRSTS